MQQLQDDQAKRQKEADDDYACHIAELDKRRMQQDEHHVSQQWRLCTQVSPCKLLHVQVYMPLPPLQLNGMPPLPPHPVILVNALPQVSVVDFVQQCTIAQILVTRQENEVARL